MTESPEGRTPVLRNRTFTIRFLGCARRQLDCERIRNYFLANGQQWTSEASDADIIVVSTCGLSKEYEDRCLEELEKAVGLGREVVLYGCLPAMNGPRVEEVFAGRTVPTRRIEEFDRHFPEFPVSFAEIPDANRAFAPPDDSLGGALKRGLKRLDLYEPLRWANRVGRDVSGIARALHRQAPGLVPATLAAPALPFAIDFNNEIFSLRVSEGCRGRCSYCTIRRAIGGLSSKPMETVLGELRSGMAAGVREVNLISSDTGSWGTDIGQSLPDLLRAILAESPAVRIRFIQDLHASWINRYGEELVDLAATGRIRSVLTAVQSGSERILGLMNRPTDLQLFRRTVARLRRAAPGLRFRTQVILGFPTETEEDFRATVDLVRDCRFEEVDVFRYFETPAMKSAALRPKVPAGVTEDRRRRMLRALPRHVVVHGEIAV